MEHRFNIKTFCVLAIPCFLSVGIQLFAYSLPRLVLSADDYILADSVLDQAIPFVPCFVLFYLMAFLQWAWFYISLAYEPEDLRYRMTAGDALGKIITAVVFLVLPVTMVRPDIAGTGLWNWLVTIVYGVDQPTNLLPSLHCYLSYLCTRLVFVSKRAHTWEKWVSLVFTLLVCASTLLVKQHLVMDVLTGIMLAEACWQLSALPFITRTWTALCKRVEAAFTK